MKKVVFVFLAFVLTSIVAGQNKKPVHGKDGIDTLHHQKGVALMKRKRISTTKVTSVNKIRRKDTLKAMNDPMTKLEKPGHDSAKQAKLAPVRRSFSEGTAKQKKQVVK
jgi:hypothetical protein